MKGGDDTMPAFDGTGPAGYGPGTGWGRGPCGGGMGWGKGMGRGFGLRRGRGLGRFFGGWGTPQATKQDLTDYRKALEEELKLVREEEKGME